ncbi:MAG: hypothetical protein QOE09_316, partial [Ilumatobacteraceae bacterium]
SAYPAAGASSGGSRWLGPVAAAALVALVGYSVISSAITSHKASTPPTPNPIVPQYYVADPPPGFKMYLAEQRGESQTTAADFTEAGSAQLWATVDASATSGSWFVIAQGSHHATGQNSYRTLVDDSEVIVEHDPASGESRLSFIKDGNQLEIYSRGWVDRQLIRLVRSVGIDQSEIHFADPFFATDHRRILNSDPATALFGMPVARVGYATGVPVSLAQNFTITVSRDNVVDPTDVAKFAIVQEATFAINGVTAVVGKTADDPALSIVQWRDGKWLITMRGNLDAARMQAIAKTVHKSADDTVRRQRDTTFPASVSATQAVPHNVVSGMLSDGWGWAIKVSARDSADPTAGYLWWIGQPGDTAAPSEIRPSLPSGAPTIEMFVEHGRTYVLAKVPRSMTGAELHVSPTGRPSTVSPLFDVDPSLADQFTAVVFFEPVPFTARIVDSDGMTVAAWPTF